MGLNPFCVECVDVFVDIKELADHRWGSCIDPVQELSVCQEHELARGTDRSPTSNESTFELEASLHRLLQHNDEETVGGFDLLRVNWKNLKETHLTIPCKMKITNHPSSYATMTASFEGYRFQTTTPGAYQNDSHIVRLGCKSRKCPASASLLGRHSSGRVEELLWLHSKQNHNHRPDTNDWVSFVPNWTGPDEFQHLGFTFVSLHEFRDLFRCSCCLKLAQVKAGGDASGLMSSSPHWHRQMTADPTVNFAAMNLAPDLGIEAPKYVVMGGRKVAIPRSTPESSTDAVNRNFHAALDILRKFISSRSPERSLKSFLEESCERLYKIQKPPSSQDSGRPFSSVIRGFETSFRLSQNKAVKFERKNPNSNEWESVCEDASCFAFTLTRVPFCATHWRTHTQIRLLEVKAGVALGHLKSLNPATESGAIYLVEKVVFRQCDGGIRSHEISDFDSGSSDKDNPMGLLLSKLNVSDCDIRGSQTFDNSEKAAISVLICSLKAFLVLYAAAVNASRKERGTYFCIPLMCNFSGELDWNYIRKLLSLSGVTYVFEDAGSAELQVGSRGWEYEGQKVRFGSHIEVGRTEAALYVLYCNNSCYVGIAVKGTIPKCHDRIDRKLENGSLDDTSWGSFLRACSTTSFMREVFAGVEKGNGRMYESCAILTLHLGFAEGMACKEGSVNRIVNKRLEFNNFNFDTLLAMEGFTCNFFSRKLTVQVTGDYPPAWLNRVIQCEK